jgi:hypothetical protein
MITRINTRVAYLERNKVEINIWVFKEKREKLNSLNFLILDIKKCVTLCVIITATKYAFRRPCYLHLQCQHC